MNTIPGTKDVLVLRTDFSDDIEWNSICSKIITPDEEFGFVPCVEFLSDKNFDGFSPSRILENLDKYKHSFIFLIDEETLSGKDNPVLCLDLKKEPGKVFRVIPSAMWSVENNLSIANMDFEEFADSVGPDGVFRGFKEG
jgi:hypothetical protein